MQRNPPWERILARNPPIRYLTSPELAKHIECQTIHLPVEPTLKTPLDIERNFSIGMPAGTAFHLIDPKYLKKYAYVITIKTLDYRPFQHDEYDDWSSTLAPLKKATGILEWFSCFFLPPDEGSFAVQVFFGLIMRDNGWEFKTGLVDVRYREGWFIISISRWNADKAKTIIRKHGKKYGSKAFYP